ncbi:signal peptide peptidase SppA [Pendulispora albinea]|uniref:Signal peptide peptidase SppA n=1 Tax=Pendulispora albinea TaxID=2741071 RepID=A0ABZ2M9F6_9BACT
MTHRRNARWVRRAPWLSAVVAAGVLCAGAGCKGRARTSSGSAAAEKEPRTGPAVGVIDVTQGLPEQSTGGMLGLGGRKHTFDEVLRAVDRAHKDTDIKGLFVRFGGTTFGTARAEELGAALEKVRKDKPIFCHGDGYTNQTMLAAARGCSKIFVSPAGEVETVGIAAQIVYMRKLLADELHLTIDFLQVGKFKGAEEPLTRDGPSPEARASLESVLADIRSTWLTGIGEGRGRDGKVRTEVVEAAEDGPFPAKKAKERGLIDEVGYLDEAREAAKKEMGAVRDELRFGAGSGDDDGAGDLGGLVRALGGEGRGRAPIALVRATGSISMSSGGGILGGQEGITEKDLGKLVARIEKNDAVKALVLRIDSPGGSALASDLLWHRLMRVRAKKPIVVSVGDMAASGGYYLASTANVIFADATSIVGSIGVVGGKIAIGGALESVGVHAETFPAKAGDAKAGARAGYSSPFVAWDGPTRERVLDSMTGIYDLFLARVAEGRNIPVEKVAASAEGRIFSGREAKNRGLVDEIGGLTAAIAKARELAKLDGDAAVAVIDNTPKFLEALGGGSGMDEAGEEEHATAEKVAGALPQLPASAPGSLPISLPGVGAWVEHVAPDMLPFVSALAPLAAQEHQVVALPYVLVVH